MKKKHERSSLWLCYANTIRFASAMAGGGDYGVFANGRYIMSGALMELKDWLDGRLQMKEGKLTTTMCGHCFKTRQVCTSVERRR